MTIEEARLCILRELYFLNHPTDGHAFQPPETGERTLDGWHFQSVMHISEFITAIRQLNADGLVGLSDSHQDAFEIKIWLTPQGLNVAEELPET